ncbi:MAG: hypothetical protein JWN54_3217, partial [Mycobacterium sp.]|nr:hypothetical protein [Mycobacterium sp.]
AAVEDNLPAGAHADVKNAYDYAGATYDFYKTLFDRDSIDGNGMQIRSSVLHCPPNGGGSACYRNAYWDGAQMVYGPGYASADDVVAHELTHGVTEHTANLYYWYQSGAINESMSDVFGEFVDLTDNTDGAGTQTPWDLGEDLPRGALRSLSNPAAYGDPDSMTSTHYAGGSGDYGGVHQNSGVGNHAAYLIATGFGGGAAGISKAAQLYYETLQRLPSGADYADLARTLQTSCTTLLGTTLPALQADPAVDPATVTVTAADCSVVDSAIAATAMTAQPSTANASAPEAPFCPDGSEPAPALFSDDMEDTTSGKWKLPTPDHPMDAFADYFDATRYGASYASSGKVSLVAASSASENTSASSKVGWIQAADAIPIPTGKQTFLWFAHADLLTDGRNDGVRVSAAVGNVHTDLGGKLDGGTPAVNGYNVTSLTGSAGGAFNGDSHGYVSSRFDLTPFAGKSVKPTFDLVGDGSADSVWWLDDVRVYTCDSAAPSPVKTLTVTPSAPTAATVSWTTPEWAGTSGLRDYSLTVDGVRQTVAPGTTTVSVPDLAATTAHTFSVVANATDGTAGNAAAATAVRTRSTIARSPSTVVYGQRVTVYGDVVRSDTGARVAVPGVLIESRPRGTSTWSRVTTVRTDANGHWVMTYAPGRHSEFRATPQAGTGTPAGLGAWAGSPSAAAGTFVAWRVNAAFASSTIRRGQTAQLKVSVAPGRYVTLELQRRVGSRWVVVQRKTSNSKGVAVLTVRHTSAGAFSYRAVARADAQLLVNGSSNRSLRVR